MVPGLLLRHPSSLEHDTGSHPERAARITAIESALAQQDWLGCEVVESPAADPALLGAVHSAAHIDRVEGLALRGGGMIDMDTTVSTGSYAAACHGAGGAAALVDALLGGAARTGASLHRPPGHHAGAARAMGFCLLNSIAVAAQHALDAHGLERVMIVDWDVHHGNGTNEIFSARDDVLFCSVHESPLYPGTGPASDVGDGAGEGFTVNLPVPGGSGDDAWCSLVEHVIAPVGRAYAPQLVLVSAGFDAHTEDPLATSRVSDAGFVTMAGSVRRLGEEIGAPVGMVLEGGYALEVLARSFTAALRVLVAQAPPAAPSLAVDPLAERALERLAAGPGPAAAAV
ncbi:MAG: histone deacetylase [Solirubrobacteraceae bacterium MAG38_C4-C5]|nr:histone deacetylase [Candidatus Siliceabacter maunaloa]